MTRTDNRNATRVALNAPILIESIGQPEIELHPALASVYSRVNPEVTSDKFPGSLRDLSTNGAFVSGNALPLLSRIAFSFELPEFGRVAGIGWTMWRRNEDCEVPREGHDAVKLPKGFGILFEAIPLDARLAIHRMVQSAS
ncbi:MAG: hypothetical protein GY811_05100 [Myxococcales bacterium]|nr:hypothetical protein [Myxococcales bacterium]